MTGLSSEVFRGELLGELHIKKDAVLDGGVGRGRGRWAITCGLTRNPRRIECGAGLGKVRDDDRLQPSLPIATATSPMRLEKPHSLSYQVMTRTKAPSITCGLRQVEGRARRVVVEVHRDQRLVVGAEDALQRTVRPPS